MLDAVIDYLPAPTEVKAIEGELSDEMDTARRIEGRSTFCGLGFQDRHRLLRGNVDLLPSVLGRVKYW